MTVRGDPSIVRVNAGGQVARFSVRGIPGGVAPGFGSIWVPTSEGWLTRIEPTTNVGRDLPLGLDQAGDAGIAIGPDAVWVTAQASGLVLRFDPFRERVVGRINAGGAPTGIAVTERRVWVTDPLAGDLVMIDPSSNTVMDRVSIGSGITPMAVTGETVWLSVPAAQQVIEVVDDDGSVSIARTIDLAGVPRGLAVLGDTVWVGQEDGVLVRIDARTGRSQAYQAEPPVWAIAAENGAIWTLSAAGSLRSWGLTSLTPAD